MAPVAKVGPLAMVSVLPVACAAGWYFTVWLVECLVTSLFVIVFPLPPLPAHILVVGGCYSFGCLHSSLLILFASWFFIPLFQWFSLLFLLLLLFEKPSLTWVMLNHVDPATE